MQARPSPAQGRCCHQTFEYSKLQHAGAAIAGIRSMPDIKRSSTGNYRLRAAIAGIDHPALL